MKINIIIIYFFVLVSSVASSNQLEWEVKEPFRFIKSDVERSKFSINKEETALAFIKNRMSRKDRKLLPPYNLTYWNTDINADRRLLEDYIFPSKHQVFSKLTENVAGECKWKYQDQTSQENCVNGFKFYAKTQFGKGSSRLSVIILSSDEVIEADVIVKDRLILGIGDSFASGEGNPDYPTVVSKNGIITLAAAHKETNITGRWMEDAKNKWVENAAEWLDKQCHRSFFSQHIMASLKLAGINPHETITVVPLACSGAEVLDGVLIPQKSPPGGGKFVKESQVNFAVKHLCRNGTIRIVNKAFYRGYTGKNSRNLEIQGMYRCDGELRKPDAVFVSVGGNDVGFAPSIAWATIPNSYRHLGGLLAVNITHKAIKPVCPKYTGQSICSKNKPVGKDRIKYWLPEYYQWFSEQLTQTGLVEDQSKVYLTAYPNPTFIEDGVTFCGKDRSIDLNEQARSKLLKGFWTQRWDLGITQSEMHDLNVGLIEPLYSEMKKSAEKYGWNFIDSYTSDLLSKGICAGYTRQDKNIPIYPHVRHGVWYPSDPSIAWAYDVDKSRWFRNTNDSILFQTDQTDSGMNGAFHPDFRTHALIADHLSTKVKNHWYDNGSMNNY
ncbi:hypothetical protein [Psychromonas sp. SR45-3]|uniref:hypothetical protein n=1 Tax=Psychromonas sp. SR45-3 TaxID=2760930 RepID=UPI0015FC7BA8|nr:hypothetical protein [Psychromonas sp. SR45-3]MBB1274815.1 hypothetical protein [Psychromonas sp. SR45-3]